NNLLLKYDKSLKMKLEELGVAFHTSWHLGEQSVQPEDFSTCGLEQYTLPHCWVILEEFVALWKIVLPLKT
ncbi:hypothetical protein HAX54_024628, partial [Datura stramonium]|nr:hypothetical protein [Datura stramonium]